MEEFFSPTEACANFVAGASFDDIPSESKDLLKRDLLDWIGCAIAGAADKSSEPVKRATLELGGNPQAGVIGLKKNDVTRSAMCNAYYGHIFEMDDVDRESISHPATVNFPVALAMAEYLHKSGKDALLAACCGFEVMLRIGAAVTPEHYKVFHTTSTTGIFGSAMVAGKLLGLNATKLAWALGNAGTSSSGLWQFLQDGAMSKFLHVGLAASNGILVALLAKEGFSGSNRILEGSQGFFAGYGRQDPDISVFKDFSEKWRSSAVSFKPYPCCRHTHSAIDAAEEIREKLKGRKPKKITLFTYGTANQVAGKRNPQTGRQAKFSTAYCVASTILRGTPSNLDFDDEKVREKDVTELEKSINVVVDPEITAMVPKNWPCRLEVLTDDGENLVAQVWNPTGDPEKTLSWEGVISKFHIMTDGIINTQSQNALIERFEDFENLKDVGEIFQIINSSFKRRY